MGSPHRGFMHSRILDDLMYSPKSSYLFWVDKVDVFFGMYYCVRGGHFPSWLRLKHFLQQLTPHLKHMIGSFLPTSVILWIVITEGHSVDYITTYLFLILAINWRVYRLCCSLEIWVSFLINYFHPAPHNPQQVKTRLYGSFESQYFLRMIETSMASVAGKDLFKVESGIGSEHSQ